MLLFDPFTDEYMAAEVAFYGLSEYDDGKGVKVVSKVIQGRCDDYLNSQFRSESPAMPILYIDGGLWMSLSFMEVQSNCIPYMQAHGRVAVGGLGLGYVVLRMMEEDDVDEIVVYEIEPRIIDFFRTNFSDRDGFDKVVFVEGNIRETMKGETFDYAYVDVYQDMLPDEVLDDVELLCGQNEIEVYHFWGIEKVLFTALNNRLIDPIELSFDARQFFAAWMTDDTRRGLYDGGVRDEEFVDRTLQLRDHFSGMFADD